VAFDSFVYLG